MGYAVHDEGEKVRVKWIVDDKIVAAKRIGALSFFLAAYFRSFFLLFLLCFSFFLFFFFYFFLSYLNILLFH